MTLADAREELITRLRADMNWRHGFSSELDAQISLPSIALLLGDGSDDLDIAGETAMYQLTVEFRTGAKERKAVDFHRDLTNPLGLAGALTRIESGSGLSCSTLISQEVTAGLEESDEMEIEMGNKRAYLWVRVECDWYIS